LQRQTKKEGARHAGESKLGKNRPWAPTGNIPKPKPDGCTTLGGWLKGAKKTKRGSRGTKRQTYWIPDEANAKIGGNLRGGRLDVVVLRKKRPL